MPHYSFITPNLCNDMHGAPGCPADIIKTGDDWLSRTIPKIQASAAYHEGGVIFVTFDESEPVDNALPMIVLSPFAKPGYASATRYTHSSLLHSLQTIFGVAPYMRDAANATSLHDLFTQYP